MSYLKDEELLHSTHNRRLQPLEFLNVDFDGTGNRDWEFHEPWLIYIQIHAR